MAREDLIPVRSKEEAKQRGAAGGRASGEARRRKRDMKERLQALLDAKVNGVEGADALALALFEKALSGDVKAYELLVASVGQSPRQKLEPIDLPDLRSADDLPMYAAAVLRSVAEGRLALDEADKLMRIAAHVRRPAGLAIPLAEESEGDVSPLGVVRALTPREALAELVRHSRQMAGDLKDEDEDPLSRLVAESRV